MRRSTCPPRHLFVDVSLVLHDFPHRLGQLKEASGLSWEGLAACLGVDLRQLQRWRKGTLPSGPGLFALCVFADRLLGSDKLLLHGDGDRSAVTGIASTNGWEE
ncbi:MAG: hypothetical protein OXG95_00325 [Chloroflexi bacterium]|nr:hypothetical protein [Chloroflexota bacterium]